MIFSDHAAGSICDVELVTDQRLYKPFFDFMNDRAHQPLKVTTMEAVYVVTLRGWWALVVRKIKKWFV